MLNHHLALDLDFRKHIFIRIVFAIRAVHDKQPASTSLEFANAESVGKPRWTPPARKPRGIADRGKDLPQRAPAFRGRC